MIIDELYHHGILGQKWGVRRYQNSDGSLTSEGKKRYTKSNYGGWVSPKIDPKKNKTGPLTPNMLKKISNQNTKIDIDKDLNARFSSNKEVYDRIKSNNEKLEQLSNEVTAEYIKVYKNINLNPQEITELKEKFIKEYGDPKNYDDDKFLEWELGECADEFIETKISSNESAKKKYSEFEKVQNKYWDDIHSLTDDIVSKYSNEPASRLDFSENGRYINNKLDEHFNTAWNSYMSRHFDDYWIDDVDERYDARDRIVNDLKKSF